MTQQTVITYVDDMDGETALGEDDAQGFRFAMDGYVYELDTTAENAQAFVVFAAPYVAAARKVGRLPAAGPYLVTSPASKAPPAHSRAETAAIRAWAKANGRTMSDRGRIPGDVLDAYNNRDQTQPVTAPAAKTPTPKRTPTKATTKRAPAKPKFSKATTASA